MRHNKKADCMMRTMLPKGSVAVMARRVEPPDSLDFFPTPPWATRALFAVVLPQLGHGARVGSLWDPACGEGHLSRVAAEYAGAVHESDVFDYGIGAEIADFLDPRSGLVADWIVTNPPFKCALEFTLAACDRAQVGVAMLVRTVWVEGGERHARLFKPQPPTLLAPFSERVPMTKGRWDPEATTATAYSWFVWVKGRAPLPPFWIPPGQRAALSKPDDAARFGVRAAAPLFDAPARR